MAAIPLGASWSSPATVAAASRSMRPIRGALHVHPRCRRGRLSSGYLSPALVELDACTGEAFRTHCQKHVGHLPEPEPEREDDDPVMAASSENEAFDLVEKAQRHQKLFRAMLGVRVAPDMFVQEKDRISNCMMKISASHDLGNVNERVLAQIVCARARTALNVASEVMDIADFTELGLYRTEISQLTANQMVRTYVSIFCNVAEDAYHMKIEMETILSFLGALRGLGAICHILVQDIVAKLKDGPLKNSITHHMEIQSKEFDKKVNYLEDETAKMKAEKSVTRILFDGLQYVRSYIFHLVECRKTVLNYLR